MFDIVRISIVGVVNNVSDRSDVFCEVHRSLNINN